MATTLNLKVPEEAHKKIKVFAAVNGTKMVNFAEQIIIDASTNEKILEEALKNLEKKDGK